MTTRTTLRGALAQAALVLGSIAVLAGCTASDAPAPSVSPSAAAEPSSSEAPAAPLALVPGGTAEENRAFFEQVVAGVVGADSAAPGRSVVDALVANGFAKESMQLTADETSVGLDADSVQVSVKMSDACLIGQYGPKSGGVHVVVAAPIATGACLIGQTVSLEG
ncbi:MULTISPECIES: DUF6993 domain-containing protein [unclassified Rathayibacter]|uniref:DUF6993 domain-containing protein n=1 Tax=unclassified Rathayibacter TaxID=2609250 RepID=UPI000701D91C|nr:MULTISPECIES: hypothetical protein [unclassified Rathayibacter]KQQ00642.1 hypothetical protein ASF42_14960 [Rathayibacter sp. Leaf294]KQS10841.1 hypothetical protein ASG06_14960 [Rathayibacter sp. Leaf185]